MPTRIGRPATCACGACPKCRQRVYARSWWNKLTPAERRAKTARSDVDRVRESDRRKMARRRAVGTPEQKAKIAARAEVRLALARGDLVRGECERAGHGCNGAIHAHHDDYTKPLDVRWLCRSHHEEVHV